MKILFKYTSRSRPELFERGLKSIIDNCFSDQYKILVTVDENDATMFKYWNDPRITTIIGESKNKVDAINRDVNEFVYDWDVLVNMSDDMIFTQKGFDNIIRGCFVDGFDYDFDKYIHFNDGNQKANVSTMHIVGIDYYKRFNYIYNPEYVSLWCDVENDIVAKSLNKWEYMGDEVTIFKHLHPAWGLASYDEQYKKTEGQWSVDEQTFIKRKANNFGL